MNPQPDTQPSLTHGLRFITTRPVHWKVPARDGLPAHPDWVVPAGTEGNVRINNMEVGWAFVGMTHPWLCPAPSVRRPGDPIEDWMQIIDPAKGTP